VELNSTVKEKIKAAMVKHYNADLKALDLSRFHTDPGERLEVYNTHRMLNHIICAVIHVKRKQWIIEEFSCTSLSDLAEIQYMKVIYC
jgi:hypothetical protein